MSNFCIAKIFKKSIWCGRKKLKICLLFKIKTFLLYQVKFRRKKSNLTLSAQIFFFLNVSSLNQTANSQVSRKLFNKSEEFFMWWFFRLENVYKSEVKNEQNGLQHRGAI